MGVVNGYCAGSLYNPLDALRVKVDRGVHRALELCSVCEQCSTINVLEGDVYS